MSEKSGQSQRFKRLEETPIKAKKGMPSEKDTNSLEEQKKESQKGSKGSDCNEIKQHEAEQMEQNADIKEQNELTIDMITNIRKSLEP